MKKTILSFIILTLCSTLTHSQDNSEKVLTDKEALETVFWIRDNPLKPMDSIFVEKYGDVLDWFVSSQSELKISIKCMGEFIDKYPDTKAYKYSDDIMLLYTLGQFAYTIENKSGNNSIGICYYSTKLVLAYYEKLVSISKKNKNRLLDKYLRLENENKLETYLNKK